MFDNGNLRQDFASRAVIFRLNEAAKTVERIWQYERPGPVTSTSMGSVEELPNGNILIGWGNKVWTTTTSESSAVIPTGVLRSNVEYYWFVVSVDDDGNSSKSEVWSFTVRVSAPVIVGLFPVYPSNGAANVPIEGELVFGRDARATAYGIQMMDESDALVLSIVVADTTLEYTGLRRGKTYRWYDSGLRDGVPTDTGDVAVFRTAMPVTSVGDIEELHQNALTVTSRSISLANDVNIIGADVYNADGALVIRIKPGDVQLTTSFARGMYIVVIRFTSGTKARTFIAC